ncbi:PH domain-containing protein [Yaniella halotolerans]|uniref:PH domain-containing protein n=1 Tax=Yaniella halotolerans TaxID=225453 RepID=UPI000A047F3A|nr:PH domain-containing protein [Yaniella halotolerans]
MSQPVQQQHSPEIPWSRVHPISPFVRSWSVLLIFGYVLTNLSLQTLRNIVESFELSIGQAILIFLGIVFIALLVAAGLYTIAWRFYQFRITADAVELHAGVVFRRRRYMRLDRLQAVDIDRPLFARLFGLSKLSLHAADGSEATLALEYLKATDAEQLRREILYLASGAQDDPQLDPMAESTTSETGPSAGHSPGAPAANPVTHPAAPAYPYAEYLSAYVQHNPRGLTEAVSPPPGVIPQQITQSRRAKNPPRELLTIPLSRVVGAGVVTGLGAGIASALWALIVGGFVLWLSARDGSNETLPFLIGGGIGFLLIVGFITIVTAFAQVNSNYNFTARTSDSGVRVLSGLLSTSSHTIPPGRIQAIQIYQPIAYRFFGWYRIQVSVAGYGLTDSSTTVLPVGKFNDVLIMLSVLAPDAGVERADELIYNALKYTSDDDGFTHVPSRARFWQPVAGRRHGYMTTPTLLLIRYAKLRRILAMIPHERIQQSTVHQSLSDKFSGTVSARFSTPPGPVRVNISNHEPEALIQLFFHEAEIAAHARRIKDKNKWMADEELENFEKTAIKAKAQGGDRA